MRLLRTYRAATPGLAAIAALALTITACGGSDTEEPSSSSSGLEKSSLTVGMLPIQDAAQLKVAIDKGYFQAEGLTVEMQMLGGGAEAVPKLQSGNIDLAIGAWVPFFQAKAGGFPLHIVADAFQTASGTHQIIVAKDSPIQSVQDLAGKKMAVNAKKNLATLLVQGTLQPQGVKLDEDSSFVAVPFPNMQAALSNGSVDAAQCVEPFCTGAQQAIGARMIADLGTGPIGDFPVGGWVSTESWSKQNPNTEAAFKRAIVKAQQDLADRQVLVQTLPTYTQINAETAATLKPGVYPTSLDASRLQRVADAMEQYGYLDEPLDVKSLVGSTN
jgi:NitT/TauT family transport system substrate-binding protein